MPTAVVTTVNKIQDKKREKRERERKRNREKKINIERENLFYFSHQSS